MKVGAENGRAGAVSESFEAGAEPADIMKTATHTQMSTTMIYNRGGVVVAVAPFPRQRGIK